MELGKLYHEKIISVIDDRFEPIPMAFALCTILVALTAKQQNPYLALASLQTNLTKMLEVTLKQDA